MQISTGAGRAVARTAKQRLDGEQHGPHVVQGGPLVLPA